MDRFLIKKDKRNPTEVTEQPYKSDNSEVQAKEKIINATEDDSTEKKISSKEFQEEILPESDDSSNSKENFMAAKRSKTKTDAKPQKFKNEWLKGNEEWLRSKNECGFCLACNKQFKGNINHINRHKETSLHKKNLDKARRACERQNNIKTAFCTQNQKTPLEINIRSAELKLAAFIAEHNISFNVMEHLPALLRSAFPDSQIAQGIKCSRKKTTTLVTMIGEEAIEEISSKLRNTKFSIVLDETTDVSGTKCIAVIARFFDNEIGKARDAFVGLIEVPNAEAIILVEKLVALLEKFQIPLENMIGYAADNAAVMMGNIGGVKALLKAKIPNLFVMGCVCHSVNTCSSYACLKLPKTIEDLARDVYSFFSHSAKRLKDFKQFQEFVNVKPHKLLRPCQTRWLSLQAVVSRMLEQWNALVLFFQSAVLNDNITSAQTILNALRNPIFKLYYSFLEYIFDEINQLNIIFQSESPQITKLHTQVKAHYLTILRCYLKKDYIDATPVGKINPSNKNQRLDLKNLYVGTKAEELIAEKKVLASDLAHFYSRVIDFYEELCVQIRSRFSFDDEVLTRLAWLEPKEAVSGKIPSLLPLAKHFPNVVHSKDLENLNREWRMLPDYQNIKALGNSPNTSLEEFWNEVSKTQNALGNKLFPILSNFAKALISLPHSSANVERIFAHLNIIKTDHRNLLSTNTCTGLLLTKEHLNKQCFNWEPSDSLKKMKIPRFPTEINK